MLEVCSLSSGSNGNSFFIKTGKDSFLVDAGISCKQICLRLEQINHSINKIKAIFITHEHSDHISGLRVLQKKFGIQVFITQKTYNKSGLEIDKKLIKFIDSEDTIKINRTIIKSLPKSHDAVDPALFCFYYKEKKVSFVTDAGYACSNVINSVRDANIIFLESNYDEKMLINGFYPNFLKQRILSKYGHLSNDNAGSLIIDHGSDQLEYVFLAHLSENNNTPGIALKTFRSKLCARKELNNLNTIVTSRYEVSPVIKI